MSAVPSKNCQGFIRTGHLNDLEAALFPAGIRSYHANESLVPYNGGFGCRRAGGAAFRPDRDTC